MGREKRKSSKGNRHFFRFILVTFKGPNLSFARKIQLIQTLQTLSVCNELCRMPRYKVGLGAGLDKIVLQYFCLALLVRQGNLAVVITLENTDFLQ